MRQIARALAVIALAAIVHPAWAGERVVVYTQDFPPYSFQKDNAVVGLATDKVRRILDRAGLDYSIRVVPWTRAYLSTLEEKNALIFSLTRNSEREPRFHWIAPLFKLQFLLYGLASAKADFDVRKVSSGAYSATCVQEDVTCTLLLQYGFPKERIFEVADTDGNPEVSMVRVGRANFYVSDPLGLQYALTQLKVAPETFAAYGKVREDAELYLAAGPKVSPAVLAALEAAAVTR